MDAERFEELWDQHNRSVFRYCAFSLGSREDAEDAAAETFSRLIRSGDRVRPDRLEAWIFTVARNLCASQHRMRNRSSGLLGKLSAQGQRLAPDPAEKWQEPEIWHELRCLNERARLVVYLRVAEDRPFADIGRATGTSQSAAKMTYYRAIDKLRHTMLADGSSNVPVSIGGVSDVD